MCLGNEATLEAPPRRGAEDRPADRRGARRAGDPRGALRRLAGGRGRRARWCARSAPSATRRRPVAEARAPPPAALAGAAARAAAPLPRRAHGADARAADGRGGREHRRGRPRADHGAGDRAARRRDLGRRAAPLRRQGRHARQRARRFLPPLRRRPRGTIPLEGTSPREARRRSSSTAPGSTSASAHYRSTYEILIHYLGREDTRARRDWRDRMSARLGPHLAPPLRRRAPAPPAPLRAPALHDRGALGPRLDADARGRRGGAAPGRARAAEGDPGAGARAWGLSAGAGGPTVAPAGATLNGVQPGPRGAASGFHPHRVAVYVG